LALEYATSASFIPGLESPVARRGDVDRVDPLRHKRQLPVVRSVLRHLAEFGPAAMRFQPLLRAMVNQDERLVHSGGWRGIAEDDEAVALATMALNSVTR
jgi:hypothetical protein